MLSKVRARLSYANVMATIAVFGMLGGASYAAVNLPKNSVDAKAIEKNAVRSGEVKNFSLLGEDFKPGQLPQGPQGEPGPAGPAGTAGTAGTGGGDGVGFTNTTVRSNTVTLSQTCGDNGFGGRACQAAPQPVTASCNPGERATGGGYQGMEDSDLNRSSDVADDQPTDRPEPASGTPTGWTVRAKGFARNSGGPVDPPAPTFTVYVVCAS